jgi:hypothetical protein
VGRASARRRRNQRGSALVEAVIILPILMLLTFGGIELGIGFGQKGALEAATRAGARKASTLTDAAGFPETGQEIGDETLPAVNAALDSSAVPTLEGLWIYRSDTNPGDTPGSCAGPNCIAYVPDTANPKHFGGPGSGTWFRSNRDACAPTPDRVSVKIKGKFNFLTGLVGSGSVTLRSTTTLQLEPTNCAL